MSWIQGLVGAGMELFGGSKDAQAAADRTNQSNQVLAGQQAATNRSNLNTVYAPGGAGAYQQLLALLGVSPTYSGSAMSKYGGANYNPVTAPDAAPFPSISQTVGITDHDPSFLHYLLRGGRTSAKEGNGIVSNTAAGGMDYLAYLESNPDVLQSWQNPEVRAQFGNNPDAYAEWHYNNYGKKEGRTLGAVTGGQRAGDPAQARQAFDNYLNSSGYQFRLKEGQDAIATSQAAKGMLNSGATLKALSRFGQGIASDEFGKYLGQLSGAAGMGATAEADVLGANRGVASQIAGNINSGGKDAAEAQTNSRNNAMSIFGDAFGYGSGG